MQPQKAVTQQCCSPTSCTAVRALEDHRILALRKWEDRQTLGFSPVLHPLIQPSVTITRIHHAPTFQSFRLPVLM